MRQIRSIRQLAGAAPLIALSLLLTGCAVFETWVGPPSLKDAAAPSAEASTARPAPLTKASNVDPGRVPAAPASGGGGGLVVRIKDVWIASKRSPRRCGPLLRRSPASRQTKSHACGRWMHRCKTNCAPNMAAGARLEPISDSGGRGRGAEGRATTIIVATRVNAGDAGLAQIPFLARPGLGPI
jgi:hypothetical protein